MQSAELYFDKLYLSVNRNSAFCFLKHGVVMKKVLKFFFTPLPKGVILKYKFSFIFRIIGYLALLIYPFCCYIAFEFVHFANKARFFTFLIERTETVFFGISVIYLVFLVLLLIVKKGYIASGIMGLATIIMSMSNYYKFQLTGDYLYPWDIVRNVGNMGELSEFVSIPFPFWDKVLFAGLVFLVAVMFFTKPEIPATLLVRFPVALLLVFVSYFNVNSYQKVTTFLNSHNLQLEDMALQVSNYSENGFTGAFVINLLSSKLEAPENYSKEYIDALLENCPEEKGEDFKKPDIILILSESFWDPTMLPNVEFSRDPLENYREIISREGTVSGRFYSTAFGGGTVRPEFEVLTGLTTDHLPGGSIPYQYIKSDSESYVSLYQDLGYRTIAIHPYTSSFYLRKEAYPLIGFEELYFEDSLYALKDVKVKISGKQISDDSFVDYIKYYMSQSDEPTFVFGISMENHQPYSGKFSSFDIEVNSSTLSEGVLNDTRNFTQGAFEADKALKKLVDFIDERERDTVLVYYGDHPPTLGANYGAYHESGMIDLNAMTGEMNENLRATPFLIYANFEMAESEMVKAGNDNKIASYHLMNAAATLISAPRTPYMIWLEEYYNNHSYYNKTLWHVNAIPFKSYVNDHALFTYDRLAGKKYSEK